MDHIISTWSALQEALHGKPKPKKGNVTSLLAAAAQGGLQIDRPDGTTEKPSGRGSLSLNPEAVRAALA